MCTVQKGGVLQVCLRILVIFVRQISWVLTSDSCCLMAQITRHKSRWWITAGVWDFPEIQLPCQKCMVFPAPEARGLHLRPHSINSQHRFIAGWYLDDLSICDQLIRYHRDSPYQRQGIMTGSSNLDKSQKDSTDVTLEPSPLANTYIKLVHDVAREYVKLYPWAAKNMAPWGIIEPMGIQHYKPGQGYFAWHYERDNTNDRIARRHLVFMTYLNDVHDQGGTEFLHQNLITQPEKGLTLVWPADWTFTHRGVVSPTEDKYIVTGWFSSYTREQFEKSR
jgi:prolyl 4-hydroxylase